MKKVLQQLGSKSPEGRTSVPAFSPVNVNAHLDSSAKSYGNVISRVQPQTSRSNVFDISTGNQISLGSLDHVDPSLFDDKQLNLSLGQEPIAAGPGFSG